MHSTFEIMPHPNRDKYPAGAIYRLTLRTRLNEKFNITDVLRSTQQFNEKIIHTIVKGQDDIAFTFPSYYPVEESLELVGKLLEIGINARCGFALAPNSDEWPETVLWRNHMLSFFEPEGSGPVMMFPDQK